MVDSPVHKYHNYNSFIFKLRLKNKKYDSLCYYNSRVLHYHFCRLLIAMLHLPPFSTEAECEYAEYYIIRSIIILVKKSIML